MTGILLAAALFSQKQVIPGWVRQTGNPAITGDLQILPKFHSSILDNDRSIRVWLPPDYFTHPKDRYPVLYMQDGQTLFDPQLSPFSHAEWRADEIAEGLIDSKVIPPMIIVGIDNLDRTNEYLPTYDSEMKGGGKASQYLQFLLKEVKPMIDRTFHTKPDRASTGIGGSSFGAVISLYAVMNAPNSFSKVILMSTAPWPDHREILKELKSWKGTLHDRIWEDVGTAEGDKLPSGITSQVQDSNTLAGLLQSKGLVLGTTLAYYKDANAVHSETAWQQRFGMALMFLYRK